MFEWLSQRSGENILNDDEQTIFWSKFSYLSIQVEQRKLSIIDSRRLVQHIRNMLKTQTTALWRTHGYIFDGLLNSTGGGKALLYNVIRHDTLEIFCGKVYCTEESDAISAEWNTSKKIHHETTCPYIVKYSDIQQFVHETDPSRKMVVFIMPLFEMSLANIIESYFDTPLCEKIFIKIARSVLSAGARFQELGLSHCDVKPENIMVKGGEFCLIDLGATVELGAFAREHTQGYCLDATTTPVRTDFDACCIAVTLLRCAYPAYVLKPRVTRIKFEENLRSLIEGKLIEEREFNIIFRVVSAPGCIEALGSCSDLLIDS
jgi:serine/threonine protein kinase